MSMSTTTPLLALPTRAVVAGAGRRRTRSGGLARRALRCHAAKPEEEFKDQVNKLKERISAPGRTDAFEATVRLRRTAREFDASKPLPQNALRRCLALTMRAPTSFNTQPYRAVVIEGEEAKKALSEAMTGAGNINRILNAPASVVFLADNGTVRSAPKVVDAMREAGAPEAFLKVLPVYIALFSGGFAFLGKKFRALGSFVNFVAFMIRKIALGIASYFMVVPTPSAPETWSHKNTAIPATVFTLAATAMGLGTAMMEGFDSRRVLKALKVPGQFSVPMIISIGYPVEAEPDTLNSRYEPEELFFSDSFGNPFTGIRSLQ